MQNYTVKGALRSAQTSKLIKIPRLARFSSQGTPEPEQAQNPGFDRKLFMEKFERLQVPAHYAFDRNMKVYGLQDGHFLVNHYWIGGSVIVFPNRYFMWNVVDPTEIKPHTLEIMNFVKPRPDYLIIGTGETTVNLDPKFYEHFKRMGITVDTCPTFEACSTFNMCVEDRYNVACALLRPRISDEAGYNPPAKNAPDDMTPKPNPNLPY